MPTSPADLQPLELGGGQVILDEPIRLRLPVIDKGYADAQLDDHRELARSKLPWRPPLELKLKARASEDQPVGTLGFGFWNDPFALSLGQAGAARKLPAPPNTLWFFYGSPPNELALAPGSDPAGWKASSLGTPRIPSLLLAAPALLAFGLSVIPLFRSWIVRSAKRMISASEASLNTPLNQWNTYQLDWLPRQAHFWVNDNLVLEVQDPPTGPLGFVVWIDNQYAILSEEKGIRFGVLPSSQPQALEIRDLTIRQIE